MRPANRTPHRRGATLVEAALVIPVFLLLVLGTVDLGLAVASQNVLSEAAREGARQAIVHGEHAPAGWNGGAWGPATVDVDGAAAGAPAADAVRPLLSACRLTESRVRVEWPGGTNRFGAPVRVTVSGNYHLLVAFMIPGPTTVRLSASSTMPIAH